MHTYTRAVCVLCVLWLCCYARMCCGYVMHVYTHVCAVVMCCCYVVMHVCAYVVMHVCAYVVMYTSPAAILGYTNINICQAFTFGSRKIIYYVNYFSDGLDNTYLYSCRLNMRGRVFYYLWRLVDINILTLKYTCIHV